MALSSSGSVSETARTQYCAVQYPWSPQFSALWYFANSFIIQYLGHLLSATGSMVGKRSGPQRVE
eukprot:1638923-Rhodomonas_salina.1